MLNTLIWTISWWYYCLWLPWKRPFRIKCPHKYRNVLEGWQDDKNFPLDKSGQIKKDRMYYAQVQGQLLILDMNFLWFFIWTPQMLQIHYKFVFTVMQTLYRKWLRNWMIIFSPFYFQKLWQEEIMCLDNKQKNYCICNRPCFEPRIACDRPNCKVEWYHYACVKVTRAPKGSWVCPPCLVEVSTQSCSEK